MVNKLEQLAIQSSVVASGASRVVVAFGVVGVVVIVVAVAVIFVVVATFVVVVAAIFVVGVSFERERRGTMEVVSNDLASAVLLTVAHWQLFVRILCE